MVKIILLSCASNGLRFLNELYDLFELNGFKLSVLLTKNALKLSKKLNLDFKFKLKETFEVYSENFDYIIIFPLSFNTLHKIYYNISDNFELSLFFQLDCKKILIPYMSQNLEKQISDSVIDLLNKKYIIINRNKYPKENIAEGILNEFKKALFL